MPKKNHRESRLLLVKECKKLNQKEFIRWCKLTRGIKKVLKSQRQNDIKTPSLYVMGAWDDHNLKEEQLYFSILAIASTGLL
ncbi:hypothetical protein N9K77_00805 [bacterium]|nr:hypothetical protein [bacterium]